jgi:hypothetical protein
VLQRAGRMMKERPPPQEDLFFGSVVASYVTLNHRFVRRDWLSVDLDRGPDQRVPVMAKATWDRLR